MGSYSGPNANAVIVAQAGMSLVDVDTSQRFGLGTRVQDQDGREWTYVLASGTIAAQSNVSLTGNFTATALAGAGNFGGIAPVALADGEYGWVITRGRVASANVASGVSSGDPLSLVTDSNGDLEPVAAVGATSTHVAGALTAVAIALANESGGLANVRIL